MNVVFQEILWSLFLSLPREKKEPDIHHRGLRIKVSVEGYKLFIFFHRQETFYLAQQERSKSENVGKHRSEWIFQIKAITAFEINMNEISILRRYLFAHKSTCTVYVKNRVNYMRNSSKELFEKFSWKKKQFQKFSIKYHFSDRLQLTRCCSFFQLFFSFRTICIIVISNKSCAVYTMNM